jgi:hypothetical protein
MAARSGELVLMKPDEWRALATTAGK